MLKIKVLILFLVITISPKIFSRQLPINPSRTISFTTKEGSYMNIDVSPDGRTLLFDLLGDIYTLPITGGSATQITRGIDLHVRPHWAADKKKIIYESDKQGVLTPFYRDLISGSDSLFSSEVDSLIYSNLGFNLPSKIKPILITVDRKSVYYIDSKRLFCMDRVNNVSKFISNLPGDISHGTLSPNGKLWAYTKQDSTYNRSLILLNILTKEERVLVESLLKKPYIFQPPYSRYSFSSDSKYIFISYGGKIHRVNVENGNNIIIPFSVNVHSDLGEFTYNKFKIQQDSFVVKYTRSANRSSDGKYLVFSALNKLFIMSLPNGKALPFSEQFENQFQPIFSFDSKWVAYVSWSDTLKGSLWKKPIMGGTPQKLTKEPGNYQHPTWSPDGNYIAVIEGKPVLCDRDDEGLGKLLLISTANGSVRNLLDSIPIWNNITFSKDGNEIFYQPLYDESAKSEKVLLAKINIYSKKLEKILIGRNDPFLIQRCISPDGKFITFSRCEDIYLLPINRHTYPIDFDKQSSVLKISEGVDPFWEKGGKILSWSYGNKFYSADVDELVSMFKDSLWENEDLKLKSKQTINLNIKSSTSFANGTIVLMNVKIITMNGNEVINRGTIVITNGRIRSIGSFNKTVIPNHAFVINLEGKTVIPGFIDVHLHMRLSPDVFPQQSWMFKTNLAYGITTVRDPSSSFDSFGYEECLKSGNMLGPRLFSVGRAARIGDGFVKLNNYNEAKDLVRKRILMGAIAIKQYELDTRIQREWLLKACKEMGVNMTNEGAFDPLAQFGMIKDGSTGIEHNPAWGDVYDDVIKFVAYSGVYFTPTLQIAGCRDYAKEYMKFKYWHYADEKMKRFILSDSTQHGPTTNGAESLETITKSIPKDTVDMDFMAPARIDFRLLKKGAKIALGSHGNDQGIGVHNELWMYQMAGFTNFEALRSATIVGANALGLQDDIGSLEVGKIADLLVLDKDPLEDIHNSKFIRYVMKDGILYNADNLCKIWPSY